MSVTREHALVAAESTGDNRVLASVFFMAFSSLLLELSLTRVFSVTLFYHFAFLAISIALLGLGAGGVFAFLRRRSLDRWSTYSIGLLSSLINAVAIPIVLLIILRVPVSLQLTWSNLLNLSVVYLISAVPFFFTGLVFSVVFARDTRRIGALYAADLVGGAAACLAVVPLLNIIGGPNAILLSAVGMGVAAMLWSNARWGCALALALSSVCGLLIVLNRDTRLIDVVNAKGMPRSGEWVLFSRWNALSRVEVDQWGEAKAIVIDADASTYIMNTPPKTWRGTPAESHLMSSPSAVCNVLRPDGEYAIIGPGGGVDVLRAVGSGSPSVTGIEINPLIATTIMREKYADYSHQLYNIPEVHIHVGDGRSWVRNSRQQFDVLQMTLVDTWASTSAGAFALSENSLYTVQAFKEYFNHLKPDGMVAITRWEFARPREAMRVVSVSMQALKELGVEDSRRHFMVISDGKLNRDGVAVTVLAKKSPFTQGEIEQAKAHLARFPKLTSLYLPGENTPEPGSESFRTLIQSNDPYAFARSYAFNVAPVTDDAPFFFFTLKLGQVLSGGTGEGIDWKVNLGVAVLFMLLGISAVAVAAFLIVPLWLAGRRNLRSTKSENFATPRTAPILYFICIGLGYILVEIAFIQRFVLFLGHPTYALTVVVFLMLLASGAGSMLSRRLVGSPVRVRLPLAIVVAAVAVYLFVLPRILSGLVGLPLSAKLIVSAVVLVPLGFLMGTPFPSGLRALKGAGEETVEWAWAMNAAASVLGSVLAMVIAIQFGLTVVLASGGVAYVAAALLTATFREQLRQPEPVEAEAT
ncbi:MAG TPA: hypothetical protein VD837_03285 [Terriglobales bacterium]|nr:hypothetical protein [Terriglobales bacterium]